MPTRSHPPRARYRRQAVCRVIEVPDEEEADREFARMRKVAQQKEFSASARAIDYMGQGAAWPGRAFPFYEYANISNPRPAEKLSGRPD